MIMRPIRLNTNVPCNGCTACCERDAVVMHPELGDRLADFKITPGPTFGQWMVRRNPGHGGCWYLTPGVGCGIRGRTPITCREFDCREFVSHTSNAELERLAQAGRINRKMIAAARRLLGDEGGAKR